MVYNPANVAKGFLSGVEAGQLQQTRGLDIEKMRKEMRAKEAQERKRGQISGLLGQYVGGEGDRGQIAGQLAGLGEPGVQALQTGTKYLQTQREFEQEPTTEQFEAGQNLVKALPVIFANQDEQVWKTQDFPYISDLFVKSGGDPALVRRLNTMPMNQAKQVMQKMFDESKTKVPTGDYKTYQDTETGKTITLNEADPKDQAYLRENRENLVPRPTRQIVGKPEDFATDKVADEMAQNEAATTNFIADIYEAQDFIRSNPAALTDVAGLSRVATNISANIDALRDSFDVELENESVLLAESYEPTFKDLGIASAEMKSIMIGLGTQQAIINNPDGKISDRDVRDAMVQIGSSIQTPEGFIKVSDRLAKRAVRVFKTRYKTRSKGKKDFEGDLGLRKALKGKDISTMSLDDLRGIDRVQMTEEEKKQAFDRWEELKRVE